MRPIYKPPATPRRIAIAILAGAAAAGCGSAGGTATRSGVISALRFAQCMRASGVPNFPDPPIKPSTLNFQSPAFQSASRACGKYLPDSTAHEQPISASERLKEIALATCMRANGVPDFPDPGPYGIQIPIGSGPNPRSPAFQIAQNACKGYMSG
jgi:hypothetical protein